MFQKREIFRIIDANFNRSREGLRVCEEISRFLLKSPSLTKDLKSVRHGISEIIGDMTDSKKMLSEARDSAQDVGRCSCEATEMRRSGVLDIFSANIERVKESLRVLEEFFKMTDKRSAVKFSELRFRVYDIEKKVVKKLKKKLG